MSKLGKEITKNKCQKVGKHLRISWVGCLCAEKTGTLKKPAQNASQCAWALNVMHPAYLAKYSCDVFVQILWCASQDSIPTWIPYTRGYLEPFARTSLKALALDLSKYVMHMVHFSWYTFPGNKVSLVSLLTLFCLLSLAGSWQGLWRLFFSLGCRAPNY